MTGEIRVADTPRRLALPAFLALPEDDRRHELIDGVLYVSPSPGLRHQWTCGRLFRLLEDYFSGERRARVFATPVALMLSARDVFVPDLVVVPWETDLTAQMIHRPPMLVVEVVSPSSRSRDRRLKFARYAELNVPQYWIVDADTPSIECYRLRNVGFELAVTVNSSSPSLRHPDFDGLHISLADLA